MVNINKSLIDTETWEQALPENSEVIAKAEQQKLVTEKLAEGGVPYGPSRPDQLNKCGYEYFSNKNYLKGYVNKIALNLRTIASVYSGHEIRIFVVDKGERCPKCTNLITGEKLISNCDVCHGTGYRNNYKNIGDYWSYADFGPDYNMASPYGNTENPNGSKESIIILDAPVLYDQTIIIFKEAREVYKIYDVEPHIIAMRGDVIAQIAQCTMLAHGSAEYKLITW